LTGLIDSVVNSSRNDRVIGYLQALSLKSPLAVCSIGVAVLIGWIFDFDPMKSLAGGLPPMAPSTAFGLLSSGLSLWALRKHEAHRSETVRRQIGKALAMVVLLMSVLTLAGYLFPSEFSLDRLWFKQGPIWSPGVFSRRPSPHTVLAFVFARF
jgi:hypothetical protein